MGCHADGCYETRAARHVERAIQRELHEAGPSLQAIRFGDWKAIRNGPSVAFELYDLKTDPGEKTNLAAKNPDVVARATKLMADAHEDHPNWPLRNAKKKN